MTRPCVSLCAAVALLCLHGPAAAVVDDDAEVILVRRDCGALDDCFTRLSPQDDPQNPAPDALTWIATTRQPDADAPLLVDIGPGTFTELHCGMIFPVVSHVTYRGAGIGQTLIEDDPLFVEGFAFSCSDLVFQDLTLLGMTTWGSTGDSVWRDVEIISDNGIAWYDIGCNADTEHYFFSSRLVGRSMMQSFSAFTTHCGHSWFFGSEIVRIAPAVVPASHPQLVAIEIEGTDPASVSVRLFGSVVRVFAETPLGPGQLQSLSEFAAFRVRKGTLHMHGGNVLVDATGLDDGDPQTALPDMHALGVDARQNSFVHTPETAFVLKPIGVGGARRLVVADPPSTTLLSPFLWSPRTDPPAHPASFESIDGADLFVETDCDTRGGCGGGGEPHLMVYRDGCGASPAASPWLDTATGRCRGVLLPDSDGDGVANRVDVCPAWADALQVDASADGIGDACQCGDEDEDGWVTNDDVTEIAQCPAHPEDCDVTLLDVNGDGVVATIDAFLVSNALAEDKLWSLECERRPGGLTP